MRLYNYTYCLWFDKDTGVTHMGLAMSTKENNPYGGHIPSVIGTKKFIEGIYKQIQGKPCLIERYL